MPMHRANSRTAINEANGAAFRGKDQRVFELSRRNVTPRIESIRERRERLAAAAASLVASGDQEN